MEVINKKIRSLLKSEEAVVAVIGQKRSLSIKFSLLIAGIICTIFFLPCLAFLFTGYYLAFGVFGGIVFLTFIISLICILAIAGTSAYVITTKNLYIGSIKEKSNGLVIVMPLNTLHIVNEQMVRNKKMKIGSLIIDSPNRMIHGKLPKTGGIFSLGLAGAITESNVKSIQNGKLKMRHIENPEAVCDLLKSKKWS